MFTNLLEEDGRLLEVGFSEYAKRHFLRRFEKDYRGRRWEVTVNSILQDLSRIRFPGKNLQRTQRVDELWHFGNSWIFKYDFKVAQTVVSAKASGNRCVVFLNSKINKAEILMIYGKIDLPKNMGEQAFIKQTVEREFSGYIKR